MSPLIDQFLSYESCITEKKVQTADVTLLKVIGISSMYVEPIGLLLRVLHVPKFFVSLVSIQRIAKMREYGILFDDTDVVLCNMVNK